MPHPRAHMASSFDSPFWDNRFGSAEDYVFGTNPNDFLAACTARLPPGPILCLAEGEGRNAVHLARHGHAVTAVDQSAVGLQKATRLATRHGVQLTTIVADLADFVIEPDSWAAIVSIFCHLPPGLRQDVHARAAAGLKAGGRLVLEAYSPDQVNFGTGGPVAAPELLMRLEDVRTEFPQLSWEVAQTIERDVIEGSGHTGRASVTQLFGHRIS